MDHLEKIKKAEENAKYFDQEFIISKNHFLFEIGVGDEIVYKVFRFGYPMDYIRKCIEDNDANHCTTTYYLLADEDPQI